MDTKLLEIRDRSTCILVLAIQMMSLRPDGIAHWFLHYRSGYPEDGSSIMLMCLSDGRATNDPYEWHSRGMGSRTMGTAHTWIIDHFYELSNGDVVDVRVILGEAKKAVVSERIQSLLDTPPSRVPPSEA